MEIKIITDGNVGNTELYMNGRKIPFVEFDIMCSFLKKGKGVKMQLGRRTESGAHIDFLSYYGGDFQKMDDLEKFNARPEEDTTRESTRDRQEGDKARG